MEHWFSNLYASIDAMRLDEFAAGLAPDVTVVVGNNPAMNGRQAAKEGRGLSEVRSARAHAVLLRRLSVRSDRRVRSGRA
jgi:hypothetical protein